MIQADVQCKTKYFFSILPTMPLRKLVCFTFLVFNAIKADLKYYKMLNYKMGRLVFQVVTISSTAAR